MPNPLNARSLLLVFLISILSPPAWTQVEGLAIWSPGGAVSYVVPKIRRMTLHEEMDWYQRNLRASAVYGGMENAQGLNLSTESATFSRVPESTSEHPIVGVILNRPMQMTSKSSYLPTAISAFQKWGPRLFAVPVGLETLLTAEEMAEFRRRLNRFDGQLGVGGDDPHPLTYQQTDTAKTRGDISVERDLAQMAYIKEYLKNGKGRVFYVCGSMQRAAILDGHGFHGDLGHLSDEPQQGPYGPRMLEVVAEAESEIALAAQATQFMTSSFHHAGLDALNPQDSERPPT